jgi:hypothetical protein
MITFSRGATYCLDNDAQRSNVIVSTLAYQSFTDALIALMKFDLELLCGILSNSRDNPLSPCTIEPVSVSYQVQTRLEYSAGD